MQPKIKQIKGLVEALADKTDNATNIGSIGAPLFAGKMGNVLRFNRITPGLGVQEFAVVNGVITIAVNAGQGANQLVQLDGVGNLPALNAGALTNLNAEEIKFGQIALARLSLTSGTMMVGGPGNAPVAVPKNQISISDWGAPTSDLNIGSRKIKTIAIFWEDNELVPKSYVDSAAQGFQYKESVKCSTTGNINLAQPGEYIDGQPMAVGDRVLVAQQDSPVQNGLYNWNGPTVPMTRTSDAASGSQFNQMTVYIRGGTFNGLQTWRLLTDPPVVLGSTELIYTQISQVADSQAGDGLNRIGNTFFLKGDASTIGTIADKAAVISSPVAGQILRSVGNTGFAAEWGPLNLSNNQAMAGTLSFFRGGTGLTALIQHSLVAAITGSNLLEPLSVADNTVVGRTTGNLQSLTKSDLRTITNLRPQVDRVIMSAPSMTLLTLSQVPDDPTKVLVWLNGLLLLHPEDYTVVGKTVTATNDLNASYGGIASDGAGFPAGTEVIAFYTY